MERDLKVDEFNSSPTLADTTDAKAKGYNSVGFDVEKPKDNQAVKPDVVKTPVDSDGNQINRVTICLDRPSYKLDYTHPWELVINGNFDRDAFINDVEAWINTDNPLVAKDPGLKHKFIAWFCDLFRCNNHPFYKKADLEKSVDSIESTFKYGETAKETLVPSPDRSTRGLNDMLEKVKEVSDEQNNEWS